MTVAAGIDVGRDTVRVVALVDDRPVNVAAFPAAVAQQGGRTLVGREALAIPRDRRGDSGTPAERLGWLVRTAVLAIEAEHGPVTGAVLTVAADAGAVERRALRDAAVIAGLPAARLIAAPVAIGMALPSAPDGRWLVCDAGAGAFTASVVDRAGGAIDRLASASDPELGGRGLDHAIAEHLARAIAQPPGGPAWPSLLAAAAALKEHLGNPGAAELAFAAALADGPSEARTLRPPRRDELELWLSPRVRKADDVCARALSAAGLMSGELSEVVLAGAGARTMALQKRLGQVMARPPRLPADAPFAAAAGAARLARMFVAEPAALVVDGVPHALALGAGGELAPIVAANAALPTRESRVLPTTHANQTSLELELWEETSPARPLGRWRVRDLPAAPAGDALALCSVTVDADGVPRLDACELVSGLPLPVQVLDDLGLDAATLAACRETAAGWRP